LDKKALPAKANEARKRDALALAELIYDMFKEEELRNDETEDGQNNAQSTKTN
jgi:hypothetical protein